MKKIKICIMRATPMVVDDGATVEFEKFLDHTKEFFLEESDIDLSSVKKDVNKFSIVAYQEDNEDISFGVAQDYFFAGEPSQVERKITYQLSRIDTEEYRDIAFKLIELFGVGKINLYLRKNNKGDQGYEEFSKFLEKDVPW